MNKKSELLPPLFVDIDETAELLRISEAQGNSDGAVAAPVSATRSIINEVDFTCSETVVEETAREIAQRRWQHAELISGGQRSERQRVYPCCVS